MDQSSPLPPSPNAVDATAVPGGVSSRPPFPVNRRQHSEAEAGAKQEALERMEQLRGELLRALEILHSVQALFELKPDVTRAEFHRFVESALERLPELQALEWIPRVTAGERARYEGAARADGLEGFHFTELESMSRRLVPAGEREEYFPVFYAEPMRTNAPALGLDLACDPRRREALDRAARTGLPSATVPLRLAQIEGGSLGFLVVMPVRTGEARALTGFGLAVFRVGRLVDDIFSPLVQRGVRIEIRDLAEADALIYAEGPDEPAVPAWTYTQDLPLVGRQWRFRFTPGACFQVANPDWLRRAAEALQRTNEILEDRVAERTAQLAELNATLQAEVEVRKGAEAAAESANRAKSLFLADMSHEIRTPLNVILGYTQLLQRERAFVDAHAEAMRAIVEGGNHLLCLVDGILDLTKIETGRMELTAVDFDLTVLVKGLAAMFGPRCQQKGLRLRLEALGDQPVWQRGDERKLRQVLVNLLGNAVKFTESGEIRLRVLPIGARGSYRFEVIDTGPGIPLAVQSAIFEPFRQEAEGRAKGGTGLGLSIARRLIELMGGSLEVNSAPGWGSNFFFALSFAESRSAAVLPSQVAAPFARLRLAPGSEVNVVVIDDHPVSRELLAGMLRALGCHVRSADSGQELLNRPELAEADLVFLDIRMADLDGIATARALRAGRPGDKPRLVACSASAFEHEWEAMTAAGFADLLPKPLRFERIVECLGRLPGTRFDGGTAMAGMATGPRLTTGATGMEAADTRRVRLPGRLQQNLLAAADIGDFAQLRRLLPEVESLGPEGTALARRLLVLAERFDTESVIALLGERPPALELASD